ncbi:hypothetical protein PIB30_088588 [Stylosanthes scabra]|uniref:Uncharacterized protein n=1 Tax=Stylosanthes scabra TaxID=79078 RepID=A0ABU6TUF6_9FABA|nr:hypothetical protein [Stylosanthes scabra]
MWAKCDSTETLSIISSKPHLDQVPDLAQTWPSLKPKALPCSERDNSTNQDVDAGEKLPPSGNPPISNATPNAAAPNPPDSNEI